MQAKLADARPDLLLAIGGDHLNQWFTDNMPAFLVGKSAEAAGPFEHETREFGVPSYRARVDVSAARAIVAGGFDHGVDFGFSDEFVMDHSFTLPLAYVRPQQDLPIVPIWANVIAPPVPPPSRFYEVGLALRSILDERLPAHLRVAVIGSGHLSTEIGGPRAAQASIDPEFDRRVTELVGRGAVDELLRECTWDRLMQAGNLTYGFAAYLLLVGLARGEPASEAEAVFSSTNTAPFWSWDLHKEAPE